MGHGALLYRVDALLKDTLGPLFYPSLQKEIALVNIENLNVTINKHSKRGE